MPEITCCYDLKCKKKPEFWVKKKDKTFPNYWYPLCSKHLKKIIKNARIEIISLKTERIRKFEHKIFCARDLHIKEHKNWKLFIDWEEITENLDIDKPITFEVHSALEKHYYNNYLKIKKRFSKSA